MNAPDCKLSITPELTPFSIISNNRFDLLLKLEEDGKNINNFPIYFLRLFGRYKEVLLKSQVRAQKKIFNWWIPICYDLEHSSGCGKRMRQRNYERFQEYSLYQSSV